MKHQFTAPLEASTSKIFNWQLRIPAAITAEFLAQPTKRRVICVLNGQAPHQCSLTPIGQGVYVIKVNQKRIKQLALEPGQNVTLELFPDDSKYGLPMPGEMQEILNHDGEGNKLFHALPAGKLRTLLYIIGQGKSESRRLFRSVTVLEHLKNRNGKIDYKILNIDMRAEG